MGWFPCECCGVKCVDDESCCPDGLPAELLLTVPSGWVDAGCDACDTIPGTFVLDFEGLSGPEANCPELGERWTYSQDNFCPIVLGTLDLVICAIIRCVDNPKTCEVLVTLSLTGGGVPFEANYAFRANEVLDCENDVWTLDLESENWTPGRCDSISDTVTLQKN